MSRRLSLAEMMGTAAAAHTGSGKLSLSHLPEILGESLPDLPKNAVGRHRLIRALQQRFGNNWRSLPGVNDIVKEFDGVVDVETRIAKIKRIKYEHPRGSK